MYQIIFITYIYKSSATFGTISVLTLWFVHDLTTCYEKRYVFSTMYVVKAENKNTFYWHIRHLYKFWNSAMVSESRSIITFASLLIWRLCWPFKSETIRLKKVWIWICYSSFLSIDRLDPISVVTALFCLRPYSLNWWFWCLISSEQRPKSY